MIDLNDIRSLTEFQRDTKSQLARIKRSGRPMVLTVNGKAAVVVQDAAAYQRLLDAADRAQAVSGIERGLASMKRGDGRPLRDVVEKLGGSSPRARRANDSATAAIRGRRPARS